MLAAIRWHRQVLLHGCANPAISMLNLRHTRPMRRCSNVEQQHTCGHEVGWASAVCRRCRSSACERPHAPGMPLMTSCRIAAQQMPSCPSSPGGRGDSRAAAGHPHNASADCCCAQGAQPLRTLIVSLLGATAADHPAHAAAAAVGAPTCRPPVPSWRPQHGGPTPALSILPLCICVARRRCCMQALPAQCCATTGWRVQPRYTHP